MTPGSVDEIAEALRSASAAGQPVTPLGGGTRSRRARSGENGDVLSTVRLDRIVEHVPAELTATVEAGIAAAALAERLASSGQWWPQADVRPGSTVGGILASAASGRGRLRHGPVRDSLLEVVIVTGDGRIVKGGGRTVKGVAGYDLPRLVVGSFGTLGIITQVTLKLWPVPRARGWFAAEGTLPDRLAIAARIMRDAWRPAGVVLTPGRITAELVGAEADVTAPSGMATAEPAPEPHGEGILDIGVPPRELAGLVGALEARGRSYLAELGVGTCRVAVTDVADVTELHRLAVAAGGHAAVTAGPAELQAGGGEPAPPVAAIMRRLKRAFDPAGILNPTHMNWLSA